MSLVTDDDLPENMKKRQQLAHRFAKHAFNETWNYATSKCFESGEVTGNEALSFYGTLLQDFSTYWIHHMIMIANRDDAGVLKEELIKEVFNGIIKLLGGEIEYEKEKELPNGIKRLKKDK